MRALSISAAVLILFTACQAPQTSSPVGSAPGTSAPTAAPTAPTGTVTVAYQTFATEFLEPTLANFSSKPYNGEMFDTLIGAGPDGVLSTKYGLLESYESSSDARVFSMSLRKGAKWHDGVEVTSDDLKFTMEHSARQEAKCVTCAFLRANMDRVEIVDKYSAKLYLKQPNVTLVNLLGALEGDLAVLPKHYFDKVGKQFLEQPLGSGPWKFASRKIGEFIEYEANLDYWNKERIPGFQRLRVQLVPDAKTQVAMLKTGEADLVQIGSDDVAPLRTQGFGIYSLKVTNQPTLFFFKSYDPAFLTNKLEFRKALILAVDLDAIVKAFYQAEVGTRATGTPLFNPLTPGYDPSLPAYPYDPAEAKRLLQQVGYKGEAVNLWSFIQLGNSEQLEVNDLIADYWRKAGINVKVTRVEFASWSQRYQVQPQNFQGPTDAAVLTTASRPSLIGNILTYMSSKPAGGFVSVYYDPAKADALYKKLTATLDAAERTKLLQQLNRELYQEYWAMPIIWRHNAFAAGLRIGGWEPSNGAPVHLSFETLRPSGR
jgi:peptide/nickel transport system substrate-binding protein